MRELIACPAEGLGVGSESLGSRSGMVVVVLSGLSGSGKTTALHALEDAGFYCVDNLPAALVEPFIALARDQQDVRRVAIAVDVRERLFDTDWSLVLASLEQGHQLSVLFLDADDEVLTNRFKTTRRPHPLISRLDSQAVEQSKVTTLAEAFALERAWLAPFRNHASLRVDTTKLTVHELRRRVTQAYGEGTATGLAVHLMSFGFRNGLPAEADFVFDVRYLDNPYFVPELREQTGLDPAVAQYVLKQPLAARVLSHLSNLVLDVLPAVESEGRVSLTIAIGCTGGQHRSVALVHTLGEALGSRLGRPLSVIHRDIPKR